MIFLTLIRHAQARDGTPTGNDFDRPLSSRGINDAVKMGDYLRDTLKCAPDLFISSPAARAIATARSIAQCLRYSVENIRMDETIYEAPLKHLLTCVRQARAGLNHVCLVGHNPGLESLSAHLLGKNLIMGLATCGVVRMELAVPAWESVEPGTAKLLGYEFPQALWGRGGS